jgi:hypothetical protein
VRRGWPRLHQILVVTPTAIVDSSRLSQLTEPWIFHWSNPGRWPWAWQVNMIHHDQVR